jgi:hypothetical protein
MANTSSTKQFEAYNLQRKNQHAVPSPPIKTPYYGFDKSEWAASIRKKGPAGRTRSRPNIAVKKSRVSKRAPAKKLPQRTFDVLRASPFDECLECGETGDDPSCGIKCYHKFRKQYVSSMIDIKGPGPHGYGAYTKPGVSFKKGQYLDEYIGDVRPVDHKNPSKSLYVFQIADGVYKCDIDSEKSGNWTRFVNSHCRPNVHAWPRCVGRRHVIVFEALRDIGAEEELTFFYGKNYFNAAGFDCTCSAYKTPHVPHKRR